MRLVGSIILIGLIMVFASCDPEEPICETESLTYTDDVKSILDTHCAVAGCHVSMTGTFDMSDYETAKIAVDFGRIAGAINHEEDFVPMPIGGDKLDDCSIDKIESWIADGAPE